MDELRKLQPAAGSRKKPKRVGRGPGSGHGKTSCKGHKGQRSRSGANIAPSFEGGQMPLNRRLPKRGFHNPTRRQMTALNLDDLMRMAAGGLEMDLSQWMEAGRIRKAKDGVKVLGRGEVSAPLSIRAHGFSAGARKKILDAGGKIEEIT
ncbi:MAG: 50S ribosomal protein L15 [bacterium]